MWSRLLRIFASSPVSFISEYNGQGAWKVSYVYLGSKRIGDQTVMSGSAYSSWRYVDPVTGDEGNAILDPQGVDVGHEDPFPPDGSGDPDGLPNGGEPVKGSARLLPIEGGGTKCVLDGISMDCSFIKGEVSVKCPNNDCGPQTIIDSTGKAHLAPLGFDPNTGRLGNYYWDSGFRRDQPADDSGVIRINNRGKYVWKYADTDPMSSFGGPQKLLTDPDTFRSGDFVYCSAHSGLEFMLDNTRLKNGQWIIRDYFADKAMRLINDVASAEKTGRELLAVTWMNESMFQSYPGPNTTTDPNDAGNWDYGPLQLNPKWVGSAGLKVDDINLAEAYGLPDQQTFRGTPRENLRLGARYLNSLGTGATAAGRFTGGSRVADRESSYRAFAPKFTKLFDCLARRGWR